MKKVVLGLALSFGITSMVSAAEQTASTDSTNINCAEFSSILSSAQTTNLLDTVTLLATNCPAITDQIVETAVSLSQIPDETLEAAEHQKIMQAVADAVADDGSLSPEDILLAALAGGGNAALLSEPTAGGNLTIVPASAAVAPAIIGGRNGGAGVASLNN
jgi:hypothetical protein